MNKVEHYYNSAWNDISDYVVGGVDKIPRSMTNEDFTLKGDYVTINIAETFKDDLTLPYHSVTNYTFAQGDRIRCSIGTTVIYAGVIDISNFNYRDMSYTVKIRPNILLLDNYMLGHDQLASDNVTTLHDLLADTTNWYEYSLEVHNGISIWDVGVLWALQCVFQLAGFTLDVSVVKDIVLWHEPANGGNWDIDITYQDIMLDEGMMWCINQSVATSWGSIETPIYRLTSSKITCYQFVSEVLSALGLIVIYNGSEGFKLVLQSSYTVTDDNKFETTGESVLALESIDKLGISEIINYYTVSLLPDRSIYASNDRTSIGSHSSAGTGNDMYNVNTPGYGIIPVSPKDSVSQLQNLVYFITDAKKRTNHYGDSYAESILYAIISIDKIYTNPYTLPPPYDTIGTSKWLNILQKKTLMKVSNYTKDTITTNFESTDNGIIQHDIDMQFTNSTILQETF
jgi:hypothetical protein